MKESKLASVVDGAKTMLSKHSPEILTGVGIAGMVATTVMAVKVTPKASLLIGEASGEKGDKLSAVEAIKISWKLYLPAAVTCVTSTACLIGACSVNTRRNAALVTAYNLSKTALTEYKEKVVETIGEKKEQHVRDKIAEDKIRKDPVTNKEVLVIGGGITLCYDGVFGRYFKSDMETIKRAMTNANRQIISDMYVSLNDFYSEIGLAPVDIGYDLGWNVDDGEIEIEFSSQIADDGTPCLVIGYNIAPKYNFSSFV